MIRIVKVTGVEPIGDFRLRVSFSDGASGVHDFSEIVSEAGPMVEPLRDRDFFQRVFISMGVLAWPNGYDLDAINLYDDMKRAGAFDAIAAELYRSGHSLIGR